MKRQNKWDRVGNYCPNCGQKTVWLEDDMGDYYLGRSYFCTSCDSMFTLQLGSGQEYSAPEIALMKAASAKAKSIKREYEVPEPTGIAKLLQDHMAMTMLSTLQESSPLFAKTGKTIRFVRESKVK